MEDVKEILNQLTVYPITGTNSLTTIPFKDFFSTPELYSILDKIKSLIPQSSEAKGGIGTVYNFGKYKLKISEICPDNIQSHLLNQLCTMSKNDDLVYWIPNTEYNKTTLLCPNYITEPIVGALLSKLRSYTPSFMSIYGCIYDKNDINKKTYQILEPLINPNNVGDISIDYFLFQIIYALDVAQKSIRYTHWDLHQNNVMIRKRNPTIQKYKLADGIFLYSKVEYDSVIIDYGHNRCETKDVTVVPQMKFIDNPSNREILDYYDFNPFYDIFTIIHSFYLHINNIDVKKFCFNLLKEFLLQKTDEQVSMLLEKLTLNKQWRVYPERLTISNMPLTAEKMCQKIVEKYERVDDIDTNTLNNILDEKKFIISTTDLKVEEEYSQPQVQMDTSYCPYNKMVSKGKLGENPYELEIKHYDDQKEHKIHNLTRVEFKKQNIAISKMMQPSTIDGVFKFRSDCCRIDPRTYFQNPNITEGIVINASFFNIMGDYTPIGPYKHKKMYYNNPIPELYKQYYRAVVIDILGDLDIITIDEAIKYEAKYVDILVCGPVLIETGKNMTDEFLKTGFYKSDGTPVYPFLCDNSNDNVKVLSNGVMNCSKISPGELGHAGNENPRSVVALDSKGTVYFFCLAGRGGAENSRGLDLVRMTEFITFQGFDIVKAVNMDGGRSSLMTYKDKNTIYLSNVENVGCYPVGNVLSYVKT